MHHGFIDHSWILWQNADIAGRLYQINGCSDHSSPCDAPVSLDLVLSSMGIRPDATVNDVMDTQGGYLCYVYDS
jgi:tyrosinase